MPRGRVRVTESENLTARRGVPQQLSQHLGPFPDLLKQNLHLNKVPRWTKVNITFKSVKWRHLPEPAQLCRGHLRKEKDAPIRKCLQKVHVKQMLEKIKTFLLQRSKSCYERKPRTAPHPPESKPPRQMSSEGETAWVELTSVAVPRTGWHLLALPPAGWEASSLHILFVP